MRILLTISYLGTRYHGWQVQKNAPTVQETVQDAIERITGIRSDLTGCSRTDAGVHALAYCCAFSPEKPLDLTTLGKALNAVLPDDIAVRSVKEVPENFHPRYSAKGKAYRYRIYNAPDRDPFETGRALHRREPLDLPLMRQAAKHFLGTHDFAAFMASGSSITDTVRTVTSLDITKEGNVVTVRIAADGFLYNMVRIIVGTLLAVNDGKIQADAIPAILSSLDRANAGATAPAEGLYLEQVFYD